MLPVFLALSLCAPSPPQQSAGEGVTVEMADIRSGVEGEAMVYHIDTLHMAGPTMRLDADRAIIRFDAEQYRQRFGGLLDTSGKAAGPLDETAADTQASAPPRRLLRGSWSRRILGALGLPQDSTLILEIRLEGHIFIETEDGMRLRCDRLQDWPVEGRSQAQLAVIDWPPGEGGPNGWPLRMTAQRLSEEADGSLLASDTAITTCLDTPPHYRVHFSTLRALPGKDGKLNWKPQGGWLQLWNLPFLPVPTPDFSAGDSFLGFRGVTYESSNRLGSTISPRFGGRHEIAGSTLDWTFKPSWSVKRGFPLELEASLNRPGFQSTLEVFHLNDLGEDRHALSRTLARSGDSRDRLRWWGRWTLDPAWRVDAEIALTSDPLVDPEFFQREWIDERDAASLLRIQRRGQGDFFRAETRLRLDDIGFTPIEGLGAAPGPAPQTLESLPTLGYDRFSTALFDLPTGILGGSDGHSQLNFAWGGDLGRLRLRDRDLLSATATPFASLPTITRTRGRLWAEAALPMNAGAVFLRPGVRMDGALWEDDLPGAVGDDQLYTEAFFDTGISLEKRYEDGWRHRVLPQLRFRQRSANRTPSGARLDFDGKDLLDEGQVLELSLRQFFFAPERHSSWLDVNLLFPYYPDGASLFESELAPFPRAQAGQGFGPAELRVNWTPGNDGSALQGLRWETRLRHDFRIAETEEIFTRMTVRPDNSFYYGFDYYEVNRTARDFAIGSVFAGLRFTEEWALGFRQSENFDGNAGLNSAWGAQYYGHDFLFEFGYTRVQASGESGVYFNISPRFFFDPFGSQDLAKLKFQ